MKTAVSIPDSVFEKAERMARRTKRSRSQLYSDALSEYLTRHTGDEVTEAMNRVVAAVSPAPDAFIESAARRRLRSVEW